MRILASAVLLTLGAAAQAAPRLAPCSPTAPRLIIPDPPAALRDAAEASKSPAPLCRSVPRLERRVVCLASAMAADGSPVWELSYWLDGRRRYGWTEKPAAASTAPAFSLERAELDGSGPPELVVAVNGSVHVLTENGRHIGPLPAPSWGRDSQAIRIGEERRCVLRLSDGADSRWYRLTGARLVQVPAPR